MGKYIVYVDKENNEEIECMQVDKIEPRREGVTYLKYSKGTDDDNISFIVSSKELSDEHIANISEDCWIIVRPKGDIEVLTDGQFRNNFKALCDIGVLEKVE